MTPRSLPPRWARASAVLVLAALAACSTVGPDYKRPEVPLPTGWRLSAADAADMANTSWWEAFGDADLSALIKAAIDANKDLLIAAHRAEQFDARLEVSQSAKYPQLGYAVGGERKQRSQEQPALLALGKDQTYNNYAIDLTFNWELDVWGRIKRSNEAARAQLLSAQETRRAVMLKVVTGVATGYVQLLGLDQQLAIAQQTVKNRQQWASLVESRYQGGTATLVQVAKAQAAIEEVLVLVPEVERQIALVENSLSTLVGAPPGPVKRGSLAQLKLLAVPQGVPSDVLQRRPDVLAAEQTLIAANADIGLAKAQYLPTVSLTGALGLASDQLRWLFARTARTGDISRGWVGTLFSGGRIEGDVRRAEANQREMAETYLQAVQTALQEINDALVSRAKAGEVVTVQARELKARQDVARLTRLRYEGGQSTYLDVLEAEREVYASQSQQAQGLRDQYTALVSVYKAMGGGWMVAQEKLRTPPPTPAVAAPADGTTSSDTEAPL